MQFVVMLSLLCLDSDQHGGVEKRAGDSKMEETPNQQVTRDTGNRQGKFLDQATHGSRCRDLIGQPECGLEAFIGWKPRALAHEWYFRNVLRSLTHVCLNWWRALIF